MDYALAHFNMIEQQIRPWDVLDMRILDVMSAIPRHPFVPDGFESLAYSESSIPLNNNSLMLEPKIIGRFLQAANPQSNESALEIGTGSGYQTALLTKLCHQVDSIELDAELANQAQARLKQLGHENVKIIQGNALVDLENKHYDVIIVNAAVSTQPETWLNQLNLGGRCVLVMGSGSAMQAVCFTRSEAQQWIKEILFETNIEAIIGSTPVTPFVF